MKILMLTPYLPYPLLSGGQIRTYNLLKNLSKKHDITLIAFIRKDSERQHLKELKKYCHKVKVFKRRPAWDIRNILTAGFSTYPFLVSIYLSNRLKTAIATELKSANYDLIHAETFYMMPNIPPTNIPTLLVEQTIEYLGYLSYAQSTKLWFLKPLLYIDIAKIKFWEKYFWQKATRLATMSQEDKVFIQQEIKKTLQIGIVSNGVDIKFFNQTKKALPKTPTVLFVGTFKWMPNIDAAEFLVEKIWPRVKQKLPQAKLLIVGYSPTEKIKSYGQDSSIIIKENVKDIRQAYSQAHLLLAPIRSGKGTRYKILEAMATNTPIVATHLAVEGLEIKPNQHALIADTPHQLAQHTCKLLADKNLRDQLAQTGKKLVQQKYNWNKISQDLDHIYQQLGKNK